MNIQKYSPNDKDQWDQFVASCKNSHFFFKRNYVEYHSDKFLDFSILIKNEDNKVIAVMPANRCGEVLHSHQGLTFGGLLVQENMKTDVMLRVFSSLKLFLKNKNIIKLIYKPSPYIYHVKATDEDLYALFINEASLIRREVTSTIFLDAPIRYTKGRKWSINRAKRQKVQITHSLDFPGFWNLLTDVLTREHKTEPAHSLEEITKLASLFPKNIKLFLAQKNKTLLAGALMFENKNIVHTQYLANSIEGKKIGALDLLIDHLIREIYFDKKYFDFGISNENSGRSLNTGLIAQKEGFGACPIVQDMYELEFSN